MNETEAVKLLKGLDVLRTTVRHDYGNKYDNVLDKMVECAAYVYFDASPFKVGEIVMVTNPFDVDSEYTHMVLGGSTGVVSDISYSRARGFEALFTPHEQTWIPEFDAANGRFMAGQPQPLKEQVSFLVPSWYLTHA